MALQQAWTDAPHARLTPAAQAKLWGLREALRELDEDTDQYEWMAGLVNVKGGGSPHRDVVRKFFLRVDKAGKDWFPGRLSAPKTGRPVEMTPQKRRIIARSMMNHKSKGALPSYDLAVATNPTATLNETTGKPFSRHKVNEVLTSDCYDNVPEIPWQFRFAAHRRALTVEGMVGRVEWARRLRTLGIDAAWFFRYVVWLDICSTVIPGTVSINHAPLRAGIWQGMLVG